ncbi:3-oxoacyl-ACP reductase family protein [Pontibacter sp. G13]|uniref:SDR family NAD(P)-dependent oxidoreductase n=1 Tax=Pontibacter sp. G13 TaxID=3074898 RepID=UPI002889241A|nr:3-oxoacyl-ACP reductase family protein [Pontibacter sp. G13]WNJ20473.1 3-oxoacyl-ACP reductase family protein [Pontibacter sp. G13]
MDLKGKVAIVTGGSRDIGRQVSLKLAALGANVVVNYLNNEEAADKTISLIEGMEGNAIKFKGDMTKQTDIDAMMAASKEAFGDHVDILVNVAGGLIARKKIDEMDEAFWDSVMDINLKSAFLVSKAVVERMNGDGGSIINFSSQAGRDGGGPGAMAYATSKGAVMTFTRALAKELGPRKIRVNALCPGMIDTTFHDTFTKDEVRTKVASATPLKREGQPDEVADLVAYLVSEEASFITGANIDINGGLFFS